MHVRLPATAAQVKPSASGPDSGADTGCGHHRQRRHQLGSAAVLWEADAIPYNLWVQDGRAVETAPNMPLVQLTV